VPPTTRTTNATGNRVKASLQLARDMVQTMYDAGMKPGDRYLSEAEGIRVHGVSRGTYREALRFLEHQGVIVLRSGPTGGAEISRPDSRHLASTIALLMQFADAPLRSILEARMAIDPGIAELAARVAETDEIAAMAAHLVVMGANVGHYRKWNDAYDEFWRAVATSSHNPLLASLSPALRAIVNSGGFVPNERYRADTTARLGRLHETIAAHDPAAARAVMLEIDRSFDERLSEGYPQQYDRVVCWPEIAAALEPPL
jgi:GntR family transcriptional regulator, transcriptional repressor for pyruvate dehydrogenase complex